MRFPPSRRRRRAALPALCGLLLGLGVFPRPARAEDASRSGAGSYFRTFGVGPTVNVEMEPLSSFPAESRMASYAIARAHLEEGQLPEGVLVEEFVNALDYGYAPPGGSGLFAVHAEAFPSPSRKGYLVFRVGVKARGDRSEGRTVARDVRVQLEFDRSNVRRYRLVGYESLEPGEVTWEDRPGADVLSGQEVTALYELKLRDFGPVLGSIRLRWSTPAGGRGRGMTQVLTSSIIRPSMERASPSAQLALVAATFAEKLRASYWVRRLGWDALERRADTLPEEARKRAQAADLLTLIRRARALDHRVDRFAVRGAMRESDFDEVPILVPE